MRCIAKSSITFKTIKQSSPALWAPWIREKSYVIYRNKCTKSFYWRVTVEASMILEMKNACFWRSWFEKSSKALPCNPRRQDFLLLLHTDPWIAKAKVNCLLDYKIFIFAKTINIHMPGANQLVHETPLYSCQGVFVDRSIFRSSFPRVILPWECHNQSRENN